MASTPFLEHVASHVLEHHDPRSITVVLPSQRAAKRFLKTYARLRGGQPGWLPKTDTLNGLLRKSTGITPISSMEALARLYMAHLEVPQADGTKAERGGFANFLLWGRLALQDFNELDQYDCDVNQVFTNLYDIRVLEHWDIEQADTFPESRQRYLDQYLRLNPLYHRFHESMSADGVGTGGAIARKASKSGRTEDFGHVILAGMSALTPAEMGYLKRLRDARRLTVFADGDEAYVQRGWEAGEFILEQQKHLDIQPLSQRLSTAPPRLKFVGCSTGIFECQYVREALHGILANGESLDDTVVVVPDGKQLSMLMQSLDLGDEPVNITMGLSWSETSVAGFFEHVFRMIMQTGSSWKHDDIRSLLCHPVAKTLGGKNLPNQAAAFLGKLAKKHWVWVGQEELAELEGELVKGMLQELSELRLSAPNEFLLALETWCGRMQQRLDGLGEDSDPWMRASWQPLVEAVSICARFQEKHAVFESTRDVRDLVFQVLNQERISLHGEPESGLQIMGIIETRAIDFKRVIVLDCNEGTLPKSSRVDSFIPSDLRYEIGLPNRHKKEAIYAYYLYRLMNRAEEVILVYRKDDTENEPSRYLKQLEEAFTPGGKHMEIEHVSLEARLPEKRPEIPPIDWTDFAMTQAQKWAQKGMSPSALMTLTQCPRNFYYKYLMQMREPDAVEETMTSSQFGSVVHHVFEKGLESALNRPVTVEDLQRISDHLNGLLDQAITRWYNPKLMQIGENRIMRQLAEETAQALIKQEIKELKAGKIRTLRGLELDLKASFEFPNPVGEFTLFGVTDRVDVEDGHPVMIDYKTGKVEAKDVVLKAEGWEEQLSSGKHPKPLQLLVYAAIALRGLSAAGVPLDEGEEPDPNHPGVRAGIRSGRRASHGLLSLKLGKVEEITPEHAQAFLEWVAQQLEALYLGEVAMQHNEDSRFCPYCVVLDPKQSYF
jgi:ATP-dependent helicase/nuclease subunit B